jgi:hypothetical protein
VTAAADEAVHEATGDSVTFSFGDPSAQLYGLARLGLSRAGGGRQGSALALLFVGREPVAALAQGAIAVPDDAGWERIELGGLRGTVEAPLERWTVSFDAGDGQGFALEFSALGGAAALEADDAVARLGGMAGYEQPCSVRGTVRTGGRERAFDGLGQRGHSWGDAGWDRIGLARTVVAWTPGSSASVTAIRPAGATDHARESAWAALWESEVEAPRRPAKQSAVDIRDCRLSTTYDADGHARRAGLELWSADADWPRRASGEVLCGSSLELGEVRLDCAFFRWHLEGHAGVGRYDIVRRAA